MTIILYKYFGEKNRVNKSGDLQIVLETTGDFKSDTSILNPSLLLSLPVNGYDSLIDDDGHEIDEVVAGEENGVLDFNYLYIAEFRRFYFVTSIVVSSNRLLIVSCEVDPLYSFMNEILLNNAMIERNEFDFDVFQEDTLIPLRMTKNVTEIIPEKGSLVNTELNFNFDIMTDPNENHIFTIAVASQGGYGVTYSDVPEGLPEINTYQAGDCGGQAIYALNYNAVIGLVGSLLGEHSAVSTFFKSLTAFPFELDEGYPDSIDIRLYKYDAQTEKYEEVDMGIQGKLNPSISNYRIIADFELPTAESFLDFSPYTHYEIYLPFYGWYELNYNADMNGDRIIVYYSVNYENGSGEVYVYDYTEKRILFTTPCQIGVSLSLSSSNAQELEAQKNAMNLNLAVGLLSAGAIGVTSVAIGKPLGAVGAGLSAVQSITSYINQTSLMFERVQSSHNGSAGALYAYDNVHLRTTKSLERENLDMMAFAHQFGRPLRNIRRLRNLRGFTIISKIHLESCSATDVEKQVIESSLLAGVIL